MAEERHNVYIIPDNFIEGGRVFNGLIKTRNLIEGIFFALITGFPLWNIAYPSLEVKIIVMISCIGPVFLLALFGINDSSLLENIIYFLKWRKNKRVLLYNGKVNPRQVRAADVMEAQEMPKDKIIDAIDSYKEKRKNKNMQSVFVEGEDFEFISSEPSSSYVAAEKKILGIDDKEQKNKTKKYKKAKKKLKSVKALPEPETPEEIIIDNNNDNNDNNDIPQNSQEDTEIEIIMEGES